ncbi:hypothetical protein [Tranquillimonas alkanivorans]|uniref:Uncharacterized protein n=1 Tax=Tranquillimonas alkanivorans TaxID=441119 RepID=A0A1I5NTM7_9RHOB|nr:hypothetical protein [Tranquillimonas alkanivorans]SFP25179.1 hypothetical protein SAMN04488047_10477 [Tranquillimonas alkanivorans]
MRRLAAALALTLVPGAVAAEGPLSAIDWLSDSVARAPAPKRPDDGWTTGVARSALPEEVTVAPLSKTVPDAVGLHPAASLGLPADLWSGSSPRDLERLFAVDMTDALPAARDLFEALATVEAPPPPGSDGRALFLARVDALLRLGDIHSAAALLERAELRDPELFRRWFDISILRGTETRACERMSALPEITPTYATRIFCLARGGDWPAAALTLETSEALGVVSPAEDALLARFLDPMIAEDGLSLPPPEDPSPLTFAMYEAIGAPLSTQTLPAAFAHADLRPVNGWKARLAAAERLARLGSLSADQLMALYGEQEPAASGGVWDRVAAVQALDAALDAGDANAVAAALPIAWDEMTAAGLAHPLARAFGPRLEALGGTEGAPALQMILLSGGDPVEPTSREERVLASLATDRPAMPSTARERAVAEGLAASPPPARYAEMLDTGRTGEAVLRALTDLREGRTGELSHLRDALALLKHSGPDGSARDAALQALILDAAP